MPTLTLNFKDSDTAQEIEMHISYMVNENGEIETWVTVSGICKHVYTFAPDDFTEEYDDIPDMLRDWGQRLYDFWREL